MLFTPPNLSLRPVQQFAQQPAAPAHKTRASCVQSTHARCTLRCQSSPGDNQQTQSQFQQDTTAQETQQRGSSQGNSGIAVQGYSPTSIRGWSTIKRTLRDANVKLLSAQELSFARDRGAAVIIDIRPSDDFKQGHIPGALNIPFYQPISGWSAMKIARRAGYALFGVFNGTEVNPEFCEQVSRALRSGEDSAIIYCSMGGSLDAVEKSKKGLQSRSLIAAWQLVTKGITNISVLRGGFSEWRSNEREVSGVKVGVEKVF